jgi:hypothetical protein
MGSAPLAIYGKYPSNLNALAAVIGFAKRLKRVFYSEEASRPDGKRSQRNAASDWRNCSATRSALKTVFAISMVTVIGPTPPGTGVR